MTAGSINDWLVRAPLWQFCLAASVLIIGAYLAGAQFRLLRIARGAGGGSGASFSRYVIYAVLGLLGGLIAFTHTRTISQSEIDRALASREVDAIAATYQRAQLLHEPDRTGVSEMLRRYTDIRLALTTASAGETARLWLENDRLILKLWVAASKPSTGGAAPSHAFLDSLNTMVDLDQARKTTLTLSPPTPVFLGILWYIMIMAAIIGYAALEPRARFAATLVLCLVTLAFLLIVEADLLRTGSASPAQLAFEKLRSSLASSANSLPSHMSSAGFVALPAIGARLLTSTL